MTMAKKIIKTLLEFFIPLLVFPIRPFFKQEKVIILQTYSPLRYGGNPMYLYEYLSEHTDYNVYWVTESEEIKNYIKKNNWKYISNAEFFHKMYITWSADFIIDSGTIHYDFLNLVPKKAIKICTMHGTGPKLTIPKYRDIKKTLKLVKQINQFDYFSFCTEHAKMMVGKNQFLLHDEKMILLGAPKCDQFFDQKKVEARKKERVILKQIIPDISSDARVIYYVPTFRSYTYPFPFFELEGFDEDAFNDFLERENIYFVYSLHSIGDFSKSLKDSKRVVFFSFKNYPLLDNNQLLMEVDLIVGDYSTLATDVAIMGTPQVFIMPDYDKMQITKGYAEDYRSLIPGPEVHTFNEFKDYAKRYIADKQSYLTENKAKRELLLDRYVDMGVHNSRQLFTDFITSNMK